MLVTSSEAALTWDLHRNPEKDVHSSKRAIRSFEKMGLCRGKREVLIARNRTRQWVLGSVSRTCDTCWFPRFWPGQGLGPAMVTNSPCSVRLVSLSEWFGKLAEESVGRCRPRRDCVRSIYSVGSCLFIVSKGFQHRSRGVLSSNLATCSN
ncbi:hypothetical protein BU24DRAFT_171553 [Aaosphaeria arxii CBS 175.79]|uniref:Uncharacterized protein n=1 Tax=Aaosphaeria arxii CBS 175.79 TaxID=1450172 RepID=A0A6A5XZP9_9PLEO|nr:uncharacterized protein BU24DRAFT_171553 [Aaosphaeria arxii CBS 175.79]KAF2018469.1 hypothetical protein BU24DRAFT_171553 [Aaosphaeria arxii CBS 175.79]